MTFADKLRSGAPLTDGERLAIAEALETVESAKAQLADAYAALAPLDAVVHFLEIEDSEDDPVEAIHAALTTARAAALEEAAGAPVSWEGTARNYTERERKIYDHGAQEALDAFRAAIRALKDRP